MSAGASPAALGVPVVAPLLPADRAPWHPLARLGAFVVALVVGMLLAQAVAYPAAAALLAAIGVRPLLADWLTALGAVVATALVVHWAEPSRRPVADAIAATRRAWGGAVVARGAWLGAWPIAAALGLLVAVGAFRVAPGDGTPPADLLWRAAAVLLPAALAEELMARGYAWTVLAEWRGPVAATAVTSVVFAGLHLFNPGIGVLPLACVVGAGVLLGLVRWHTGSLVAAWAAHVAWNATLVLVAHAPVSGVSFPTPGWRLSPAGPSWLTGGEYGPEGTLPTLVALGVAILLLRRRRPASSDSDLSMSAPRGAAS